MHILAVNDTYDTVISHQTYYTAFTVDAVVAKLKRCSGSLWDPEIASAFISIIGVQKYYANTPSDIIHN